MDTDRAGQGYAIVTYDGSLFAKYKSGVVVYADYKSAAMDFEGDDMTILHVKHDNMSAVVTDTMAGNVIGRFPCAHGDRKMWHGLEIFVKNYDFFNNYTKSRNCGTIIGLHLAKAEMKTSY